ncbi:pyridoxal-dependent decarboxylase [Patescibacteria group bacterium]|nr:pyridoxal-dependent decarboxylase [Patescibacteria group bacterium]
MFAIKTYIKNNILYPKRNNKFPDRPVSKIKIKAGLWGILNKVKNQKKYTGYGHLVTYPEKVAANAWKMLLPYNPNNLGNWSIKNLEPNHETAKVERDLILQMIDLYHGNKNELEGYVTTGGTEANIFSAWLGIKYIEKRGIERDKICLIKTSLTHYSIEKAADIVGVPTFIVPLNDKTWNMDAWGFEKEVENSIKKGKKGFLVPLTLGYTVTGTNDPIKKISRSIEKIKKKHRVEFFIWFDAALNGLIEPFLNNEFKPFSFCEIQTFLTDFHKFGFTPLPAGIILYRKELRQLIEKPITYLEEKDNTLLGSRSGIAPVACWAIINLWGKNGFKRKIYENLKYKYQFINKIKNNQNLQIITNDNSLTCAIVVENKSYKFKWLSEVYGLNFKSENILFNSGKKNILRAKIHFLNH